MHRHARRVEGPVRAWKLLKSRLLAPVVCQSRCEDDRPFSRSKPSQCIRCILPTISKYRQFQTIHLCGSVYKAVIHAFRLLTKASLLAFDAATLAAKLEMHTGYPRSKY